MPSNDSLSKGPPGPAGSAPDDTPGLAASRKPQDAGQTSALLADPFDAKLWRLARLVLIALAAEIAVLYLLGRALS